MTEDDSREFADTKRVKLDSRTTDVFVQTEIPGLSLWLDYITQHEEEAMMRRIDEHSWDTSLRRCVQQYGYKYSYSGRDLKNTVPVDPIPDWALPLIRKLISDGIFAESNPPQQLLVNEYEPGQGISAHVDHPTAFGPVVASVSLGSGCELVMERCKGSRSLPSAASPAESFTEMKATVDVSELAPSEETAFQPEITGIRSDERTTGEGRKRTAAIAALARGDRTDSRIRELRQPPRPQEASREKHDTPEQQQQRQGTAADSIVRVYVPPRSCFVLSGEARYLWKHCIPARKSDVVRGERRERTRRVSLTFRTVLKQRD